ncbi:DUF5627 domain-containing protein [Thermophagus xiamenensis]|uniref:Adhesin n=1 Tax=Thermophagus xiamenensis TaxID=385682 RepID=A0A1I1XHH1_9BACT|nr:DUF5627 domain-containing protein [Thermophagus xiamenensis]SFE06641.1 protein of unknown function [Thermophagus xiamenensis]
MKLYKFLGVILTGLFSVVFFSCENQDVEFPDFDYTTVYFAYQYPVRTIVLGEDIYDNSLDNEYKCMIYATMGGVYSNDKLINIDIAIDNSLCNNLFFENDSAVVPMPDNYYSLASNKITLDKSLNGGVEVQLSNAFFEDPKSLVKTYVIPLVMTNVSNADSILSGVPMVDNPVRTKSADWDVQPKDFVLYCVKFINPWHGNYLRRGTDLITEGGETTTVVRHEEYVEYDEVVSLYTASLNSAIFPVQTTVEENGVPVTLTCELVLTFDDDNKCTITSGTEGISANGSGEFVKDGDKNSWGNQDRDVLYLDYQIDFGVKQYDTKDTLVVRDRGVTMETFNPVYIEN